MIFRLSQKLNTKINAGTLDAVLLDENLYADWSCHLFSKGRRANISLLSLLPWSFCPELVPTDLLPTMVGQNCFNVVVETYPASLNRALVTLSCIAVIGVAKGCGVYYAFLILKWSGEGSGDAKTVFRVCISRCEGVCVVVDTDHMTVCAY